MHVVGSGAKIFFLCVVALLSFSKEVFCQQLENFSPNVLPRVEVLSSVEKTAYHVNEEIPYRLIMRWKERYMDLSYRTPQLPLENLTLIETAQTVETRFEGNERIYERIILFRLKPIKAGRAAVGKFVLEYGVPEALDISRVEIAPAIFEIKEPILSGKTMVGGLIGVGLIVLSAAFGTLRNLWGHRRAQNREEAPPVIIEDECLVGLEKLKSLIESDRTRECVARAGEIFRGYLQRKFGLTQQKVGSLELLDLIERRRDIVSEEKKEIRAILENLSESQFAGVDPHREEAQSIHAKIYHFILQKKVV